jgi:hypothetical protein
MLHTHPLTDEVASYGIIPHREGITMGEIEYWGCPIMGVSATTDATTLRLG